MELRCSCGGQITRIEREEPTVASARCAICSRRLYLFLRDTGEWETQAERQRRLRLFRVCDCGQEFELAASRNGADGSNVQTCPACRERSEKVVAEQKRAFYVRKQRKINKAFAMNFVINPTAKTSFEVGR